VITITITETEEGELLFIFFVRWLHWCQITVILIG